MPLLTVNLDDAADCRRGIQLIRQQIKGSKPSVQVADQAAGEKTSSPPQSGLPLRKKLLIIQQRGVWRHLVSIARQGDVPKSLPEWDAELELPRNKMRSLKAIFAKLENRWDVRLMQLADDAGVDGSGNPRYVMPPRVRNQILRLAE